MRQLDWRIGGSADSTGVRVLATVSVAVLLSAYPPIGLSAQTPARTPDSTTGQLYAPGYVQERDPTTTRDDEAIVKTIEHKMRCTCGCNLDVFTCRTTDFTCTTSPAMHRVVLARLDSGMTAEQVTDAFEAQYGQSVMMQPPKRGFNWAAYIMPFVGLGVGIGLLGMAMRRLVAKHAAEVQAGPDAPPVENVNPDELAKLKRELEKFEA